MAVYFMRCGSDGPVKIGFAANPVARMAECQTGNPAQLHLIRTIEGGRDEEAWFHREFKNHHMRGEWFTFSERMMDCIPVIDRETKPRANFPNDFGAKGRSEIPLYSPSEIEEKAKQQGSSVFAVTKSLGISYSVFSRWRSGHTSPLLPTYIKIVDAVWALSPQDDA
jgi:hypothetical protein